PTKKIHSNFGRKFPEQLSRIQAHLTLITNLLRNFSNQKIIRSIYPSTGKLTQLRTRLPPLTKEYVHQDIVLPDDSSSFNKSIMESLRTSLYQLKKLFQRPSNLTIANSKSNKFESLYKNGLIISMETNL